MFVSYYLKSHQTVPKGAPEKQQGRGLFPKACLLRGKMFELQHYSDVIARSHAIALTRRRGALVVPARLRGLSSFLGKGRESSGSTGSISIGPD